MKKILAAVLLSGLVAYLVAGCGPTPVPPTATPKPVGPTATPAPPTATPVPEPVTVVFWHTQTGGNAKALDAMVADFNATNTKKITIKAEFQGNYTQLYQKILAAIQAGSPPDMAVAYESQIADYMKARAVIELDDFVNKMPKESLADIFTGYMETNKFQQYGNKMLSFPFTKSLLSLYYNEDMLKAAGVRIPTADKPFTWDEFEKAVMALQKKDASGKVTQYGLTLGLDASTIDGWIYSRGGKLLKDDLSGVAFNAQPAYDAYALVDRLVKGNYAYQSKGYDYQADFGNKKVAMFFGSSTGRPFVKGALTDKDTKKEKFKWGITMIPQGDPAKLVTVMYGANITVFKTTPAKQAAAWEFIKWFTDTPQSVKWSITSSYMPIRKSAAENADLKKAWETDIQGKQSFDMIQYSRPEPNVRGWQDARTFLEDALQSVISGKATPKDAVDTAAAKTNKAIEEAR